MAATVSMRGWRLARCEPRLPPPSFLRRLCARLNRLLCGLMGHEMVRHFEANRISLRCDICGIETRGWQVDVNPAFPRGRDPVITRRPRGVVTPLGPRPLTVPRDPARAA